MRALSSVWQLVVLTSLLPMQLHGRILVSSMYEPAALAWGRHISERIIRETEHQPHACMQPANLHIFTAAEVISVSPPAHMQDCLLLF